MADHQREWQVFIENSETVIEALKHGECDGILPAARGFWTVLMPSFYHILSILAMLLAYLSAYI